MIVFCDIETTGLDPHRHAITEVAFIKGDELIEAWIELKPEERGAAEAMALKVNHYYDRKPRGRSVGYDEKWDIETDGYTNPRRELALEIRLFTDDCVLAGNNVKFDQQFLEVWLRKHGACPTWNYHVLDVPTFAAGVLCGRSGPGAISVPFKSSKVSEALAVSEPEGDDAHTALADALWSKALYERVLSL